jgi:hypothetical protein
MKLKLPFKTKLKDGPLAYRLLLRLVTLSEQGKDCADLKLICDEEHSLFSEGMNAINLLVLDKHISVEPTPDVTAFKFQVDQEIIVKLRNDASAYKRHVAAAAGKPASPPRLPSIPENDRAALMAKAKPLANKLLVLEKDHAAWQLAGCIARIGLEPVAALVAKTCADPHLPQNGAMADFFEAYCAKRDEMFPKIDLREEAQP